MTGTLPAQRPGAGGVDYPWIRFWCSRENHTVLDESGFLRDPEAFLGSSLNPNARTLETWDEQSCVVLLGEAGIGKSHEARRWHDGHTEHAATDDGPRHFFCDLGAAEALALFKEGVLEAPWRSEWQGGTAPLHLTFDGLDEAPAGSRGVAKHLVSRLRELPIERVRLRVACRTAAWLEWLGQEFEALWCAPPTVLELLPLRHRDVVLAAEMYPVAADAFLREIMDRGVQALASQPLALDFLLSLFARGRLPSTRADLYRQGLVRLAAEPPSRRTGTGPGRLSDSQRLAVAERIAACTLLSGAGAISIGDDGAFEGTVHESALLGGSEGRDDSAVQVDRLALRETLDTGLFSGRGAERLGFAHHSYAECLAAAWLAHHDFTLVQIYDLLGVPSSMTPTIAPQWHGLTAWLSGMRSDVLDTLLRQQPEVLLDADAGVVPADRTPELLLGYLRRVDSGAVAYPRFGMHRLFQGLDSQAAAAALRTCIDDDAVQASTRCLAIRIARDSSCVGVLDDLAHIALDATASTALRAEAAYTIYRIGDPQTKARLKPLALEPASGDEDDELRGAALCSCWPGHMTCAELLAALRPRRNPNLVGLYRRFLSAEDTVAAMDLADLPQVLSWLARRPAHAMPDDFEELRGHVLDRAAEHLGDARIVEALAAFAIHRIRNHAEVWEQRNTAFGEPGPDPFAIPERRRRLMRAVVAQLPREIHHGYLRWTRALLRPDDFTWILDQVIVAPQELRWAWLRVAQAAFDFYEVAHWSALLDGQGREPRLREWLASEWPGWWTPWSCPLEPADEADVLRSRAGLPQRGPAHQARLRVQARRRQATADALRRASEGNPDGWDEFVYRAANESVKTVVDTAYWSEASTDTRLRVVEAALSYLSARHISEQTVREAVEENRLSGHASSTFAALKVVAATAVERLRSLPAGRWREWFPIALWFAGVERDDALGAIIAAAWSAAPEAARATLLERAHRDLYPPFDAIEEHWDAALSASLLDYIREARAAAPSLGAILKRLLAREVAGARELAESLLSGHGSGDQDAYTASIGAAQALLATAGPGAWPIIEPILVADPPWGVRLLLDHDWEATLRLAGFVTDAQLTSLVGWFIERFPPERDPKGVSVGPPVGHIRDRLIDTLKQRGTEGACAGLHDLEARFPQHAWLRQVRLDAVNAQAQATWIPIPPDQLLRLAANRTARRIESGGGLLALLVESLRRLEAELHGTTPTVRFLWNLEANAPRKPRVEEDVSDWIAQHLQRDLGASGLVVNREVQIRRRTWGGGVPGECTDIRVDLGGSPRVSAFIEVKGSWNVGVATAMESQLVGRYLQENQCRHGLYLVGWFHCDAWQTEQRAPFESIEACRDFLANQAAELNARAEGLTYVAADVLDCRLR